MQLQGVSERMLLNAAQEQRLWSAVLAADAETAAVRTLAPLAAMCAESYGRLCAFRGRERLYGMRRTLRGDGAAFARWVDAFEQQCQREGLLSAAALPGELARLLRPEAMDATDRELVLTGFDELTPATMWLLERWRERGGTAEVLSQAPAQGGRLVAAASRRDELRGFARWARERLSREPEARIGLIVADLAGERDELESVLREVLSPELEDIERDGTAVPFEFSLGRSLASEPLVRGALEMLAWLRRPQSLETLERLVLGPAFAGHVEERAARGELLRLIPRENPLLPEATIDQALRALEQRATLAQRLPMLRRALRGLRRSATGMEEETRQSFGAWADQVRTMLEEAQWGHGLSSRGYQVVERWDGVLDLLASLGFRDEMVTWVEVMTTLERLAQKTVFAPERREMPVQVLGPREAAGSEFDAVWVLRAGEMQWPPEPGAASLLPRTLGRVLGVPGFDGELDRRRGAVMTERLRGCATDVIFSFAEQTAEGGEQRPAAEVVSLRLLTTRMTEVAPAEAESVPIELERMADSGKIAPLREVAVHGGVRVLELQAQCGFRAFAELRLHAKELERGSVGMSTGDRGSAVHEALEELWDRLRTQEALLALPEADRRAVIEAAVERGLRKASRAADGAWARSYLDVQRERMRRLLWSWLRQEEQRPPFAVSQQEEKYQALQVGPLELSVRVDRVDLVNGKRVLLDYKTGAAEPSDWRGERPERPQVPLYAVLASAEAAASELAGQVAPPLGAVAYAKVVAGGQMGLKGYEEEGAELLPERGRAKMEAASFAEQVEQWSEVVTRLATEFADGDARVRPRQFPKACLHCGQRILCRVDAADFAGELADEDEDEAEPHR